MNVDVMVLSPALVPVGMVNQFTALRWMQRFNDIGDFTLWCPLTTENATLLVKENLLWLGGDDVAVVESIKKTNTEGKYTLEVSGRFIESWLLRRVIWDRYTKLEYPSTIMRELVTQNVISPGVSARTIAGVVLASGQANLGTQTSVTLHRENLWETMNLLAMSHKLTPRLRYLPSTQQVELFIRQGTDRSASVTISSELDDILSSSYVYDGTGLKTVALVAGAGEGVNRKTTVVNPSTAGLSRLELFVDAEDLSDVEPWDVTRTVTTTILDATTGRCRVVTATARTNQRTLEVVNTSVTELKLIDSPVAGTVVTTSVEDFHFATDFYNAMMAERGSAGLAEALVVEDFDANVYVRDEQAFKFGVDYFLGDRVTVQDTGLQVQVQTEITEAEQTWGSEGYGLTLTLGKAAPTISQILRRKG